MVELRNAMGVYDFSFYDLVRRNHSCFGCSAAWFEAGEEKTFSFADYGKGVDRLASGLQKAHVGKGDRIGVLAQNSFEYFLLYGAAAALGAIVVPINWRLSPEEVRFNVNDCGPGVLFVGEQFQEMVQGLRGDLSCVKMFFNLGQGSFRALDELMDNQGGFEPASVCTDDGFVIIHTAAIGGRPRGALLSHGNVLCADMVYGSYLAISPEDVHLNILPLYHVGGLFFAAAAFHAGAMNVNMHRFDPAEAVRLIEEKKGSFMFDFSPILSSILEEQERTGREIGSLRAVAGLESPEVIEDYQQLTGGTFYCLYGQTETSGMATFGPYDERPGSAGKMLPMADVRVVDENDRPVPPGTAGEIVMRGPLVFKGYWNLPQESEDTLRGGWHHTGDLGKFDQEGFLWYVGRKAEKELIKPGGENVYPFEVEKAILEHDSVEQAVVFGVPDPKWKEGIKAVCRLSQGEVLEAKELMDFVGERIARYKKPQYIEFVDEIPVLEDGSIDRAKVKELYGGAL